MRPIRYAVVGLGHIAQAAVLPAFANASRNSELAALVSGDPAKRKALGKSYDVPAYSYEELDGLLARGGVDAVYIALPNNLHLPFAVKAASHGVHVLCEKPMALSVEECEEMIRAADEAGVKLMIAYRLHFEETNLQAVELLRKGRIGEPRLFSSIFSYQVRENNIRTRPELGGGPLFDIGIYCVNAARYLFRAEPVEVSAFGIGGREPRFDAVEEAVIAILRFPEERLAMFSVSFGAANVASYRVVGTEGDLHVDGHHTVEDVGITLGQAVYKAVGDKKGIRRYGHAYVPLDEALSRVVIDFSGRPGLVMNVPFKSGMIGTFDSQLAHEFFQGFANHAFVTLHIDNLRGENAHHQAETVFKAFARALRSALELDPRAVGTIPSTKGSL